MINMGKFFLVLVSLCFINFYNAQKFSGTWRGIYIEDSTNYNDQLNAIYLNLNVINGLIDAKCKIEPYKQNKFISAFFNGVVDENKIHLSYSKKIKESGIFFGDYSIKLVYHSKSGYLIGQLFKKGESVSKSKIILYKQELEWKDTYQNTSHGWIDRLITDFQNGVSAPIIRKEELKTFVFEPVYFDYDKYEIKDEYQDYLRKMIKMVLSHSDLRIKITGHTDADGSDLYNLELSKKRAKALINFFNDYGIESSRIVIDFKGETLPVESNKNEEGKQRNRRVEFEFI